MGPLSGLRVLEIASAAPAPFACMMLADMGADVLRIDRPNKKVAVEGYPDPALDPLGRGRQSIAVDLKSQAGRDLVLSLCDPADVVVEGFRPGVMERLGLDPEVLIGRNPRLIIGRMTGWGQTGPLAERAGHDINYVAVAGALHSTGRIDSPPSPALNLVGDFGGGGMLLTVGILSALVERSHSGHGQIVDAAMIDGASLLMASVRGMRDAGSWNDARSSNLLDGGAPFYDTYETADGKYMSVGALEPQFYKLLLQGLGIEASEFPRRMDPKSWPEQRTRFAIEFAKRSRDEWSRIFDGTDACVFPVLEMAEVPDHQQVSARAGFADVAGQDQPAPAPRFSRTPSAISGPSPRPGVHDASSLGEWGLDETTLQGLADSGVIWRPDHLTSAGTREAAV
ncbi:CaiB/BaiF CoA-transferase family protein [Nocardia sp. 348MFTsu5.1]|uniref:CaiB/BaiF CoA transferase family protein n=1 Tax=Nocardia sp. 348MFTsu5.1 TaxID=1172185 RepID=UPI00035F34B8|nr:CaiB/BaiF CoA-transferase family protein [Nocardia sp. 348MFTsu5.1]